MIIQKLMPISKILKKFYTKQTLNKLDKYQKITGEKLDYQFNKKELLDIANEAYKRNLKADFFSWQSNLKRLIKFIKFIIFLIILSFIFYLITHIPIVGEKIKNSTNWLLTKFLEWLGWKN